MPNYIKLGNLRIEIPEPANNGGGGGGGGSSSLLTGLLAFYNLSDLTDASGNGNTLTNNGISFSAGKIGNAANGGSGSQYLTAANLTLGNLSALTVTFWTNHQDKTGGDLLDEIFGAWYGGSNPFLLAFGGFGQYQAIGVNTLGVGLKTSSGMKFHWDTTPRTTNAWRFVAAKFVADDAVSIKTNNEAWLSSSVSGGPLSPQIQPVRILDGGDNQGLRSPSQLDALGIWNRALTDAEVTELYNAGAGKEHPFA
ncbi:MAG: hypothetical protein KGR46_07470 [Verrucomicrobia bacterium]|nr:hypothetical protein [Verrucomicrobiota bacterium]